MKVAFFLHSFPTISETFILNQITGLIDLGVDIEIFAFRNPKQEKHHLDIDKYRLMNKVTYLEPNTRIKKFFELIKLIPEFCFRNTSLFIECFNIKNFGRDAIKLRALFAAYHMQGSNSHIIYCHFGPMGLFMVKLKSLLKKNWEIITSFHGYDLSSLTDRRGNNIYKELFTEGDIFLPISKFWKRKLISMGCSNKKIIVHHMGVDTKKFKFFKRKHTSNQFTVLTVGRLVEKKGYEFSIKAVAKLIKRYKNIKYIIVGDGPLRNKLKSLVTALNLDKHVTFTGWLEKNEAIDLYKKADVFLLPSITAKNREMEGIPVVLMEAQSSGIPVISTYHSGIPEIVSNNKSGFLVREKDVDEIVKKLQVLIKDDSLRFKMGRVGRKIVMEEYDIRKLNKNLKQIFENFR